MRTSELSSDFDRRLRVPKLAVPSIVVGVSVPIQVEPGTRPNFDQRQREFPRLPGDVADHGHEVRTSANHIGLNYAESDQFTDLVSVIKAECLEMREWIVPPVPGLRNARIEGG